jgi:transcriptional regulator with XRE-family HTH domain
VLWRDLEPVRSALVQARALHLDTAINGALERNRAGGREPSSFTELADLLHRDKINLWRWRKGHNEPNVSDVLSLAQILGVPLGELYPPTLDSLPRVVRLLRADLTVRDAVAYSDYVRLSDQASRGALDRDALDAVVTRSGHHDYTRESAAESIWRVADQLEPVLRAVAEVDARGVG